jgi:L-asparaginase
LSFALCDITVPVILTGGMLPLGVAGNDSAENLQAALSPERDFLPAIWVEFDAQRFPGAAVTKFHSADNNAFLATHKISNAMTAIPESTLQLLRPANIVIITITPGMSADWLAPALQDADAAILRVFGAGTIGSDAAISPMIIRMRAAEKPLVLVSQCIFGGLKLEYAASQPLRQSGLVNGGRMTVEAAYAKILYALSMDLSYSERCALLAQPLCGEMDEID